MQERGRDIGYWAAASALVAAVGFYYWAVWGDVSGFVGAIDAMPVLFADFFLHFLPAGQQIIADHRPGPLFVYSPTFALSLAPLTVLPPELEVFACGFFEFGASVALLALSLWMLRSDHPAFAPLCVMVFVTSFPILHNFGWGQVSVPLTLCLLLGYYCHERGWIMAAAVLILWRNLWQLFVPQRFDGVHLGCSHRRIDAEDDAYCGRDTKGQRNGPGNNLGRGRANLFGKAVDKIGCVFGKQLTYSVG